MTRFTIGLLLGLLIGIAGTAAFLITAGGGDYLIVTSPRVRELEAALKNVDQDRQWLRERLDEAHDALAKLESRFTALAARFESITSAATGSDAASSGAAGSAAATGEDAAAPTQSPAPTATPLADHGEGGADGAGLETEPADEPASAS
ncbi:MAG TPA: hypothetical protein VIS07_10735 [Candidatus Binatia bacterium]